MALADLTFSNRLLSALPADPIKGPELRQVRAAYSFVNPTPVVAPQCIAYSEELLDRLHISPTEAKSRTFAEVFVGNRLLEGMQPHATCYGGHQFGNWASQLGDGRAINLGEVKTERQEYLTLQLKGAGPTPYSRSADGRAVLRSSIREFLCSEAMYHLGIPTTRALSLCLTGEQVERDMFYDGHPQMEPGAVVCRVSPSFTRFGHFQLPAFRQDHDLLRQWVTVCIQLDFPHLLNGQQSPDHDTILQWFSEVCDRTCTMIVHWMRVGFVHGVMNTDNMSVLGETIDYGPYGWLDDFDPNWTPNTTDAHGRRYRYGAQPEISHWNLYQLANAIYPLIEAAEPLREILDHYEPLYRQHWQAMMAAKLGLSESIAEKPESIRLFHDLEALLSTEETDMTLFYRNLADWNPAQPEDITMLKTAFYRGPSDKHERALKDWLQHYARFCEQDRFNAEERIALMQRTNPKYVLRNYLAQEAIDLAEQGDYERLHTLQEVMKRPYEEQPKYETFAQKRPDWARHKPGCSMLSCSS